MNKYYAIGGVVGAVLLTGGYIAYRRRVRFMAAAKVNEQNLTDRQIREKRLAEAPPVKRSIRVLDPAQRNALLARGGRGFSQEMNPTPENPRGNDPTGVDTAERERVAELRRRFDEELRVAREREARETAYQADIARRREAQQAEYAEIQRRNQTVDSSRVIGGRAYNQAASTSSSTVSRPEVETDMEQTSTRSRDESTVWNYAINPFRRLWS